MKANEAPEKLYLSLASFEISDFVTKILTTKEEGNIEYIRTDAFIEKACEWLDNRGCLYVQYSEGGTSFNNKQFIGDFKKAMKGE